MIRIIKNRHGAFSVELTERAVHGFCFTWPFFGDSAEIDFYFAPNGDLADLEIEKGAGNPDDYDGAGLSALADDAKRFALARLDSLELQENGFLEGFFDSSDFIDEIDA